MTGLGELSGAVGVHVDNRNTRGQSFEGRIALGAGADAERRRLLVRGAGGRRGNCACRRRRASSRRRSTARGWWSTVTRIRRPGDGTSTLRLSGRAKLHARERRPGPALRAAVRDRRCASTGSTSSARPDAAELFSKGMHEATGTFEIGNPFLGEEKAATAEIGLKKATGALRFDASAYYTRYDGFIYRQLTGVHLRADASASSTAMRQARRRADDDVRSGLLPAARRDLLRRRAGGAIRVAPIWNGVWGVDGAVRLRARRVRERRERAAHPPAPARRRRLLPRRHWLARVGAAARLRPGRDRPQRDRDARLHARQRAS